MFGSLMQPHFQSCPLCSAVKNSLSSDPLLCNTLLQETENFVVLPSIGPMEIGHILIISKNHFSSLALSGEKLINEFGQLILDLKNKEFLKHNTLLFEHGASLDQMGGTCIIHTHIHCIPNMTKYASILDDKLPLLHSGIKLEDIVGMDIPYILTIDSQNYVRIYEAYNAHSQMLRKSICQIENRTDSDWTKNEKISMVEATIKIWRTDGQR